MEHIIGGRRVRKALKLKGYQEVSHLYERLPLSYRYAVSAW
jgi:hypothetical protein